jgi:pSer/pThr/pTyr-binding forkhead associated (FHA) protein
MGRVTFQVLDGLERGQVLRDLPTPVTIGREEENLIRLNDERVSRFHAKVQEQNGQYILTDLDSTNGTRVNGHPVHMHVLHVGDQVLIGRCLLLFGSPEELEQLDPRDDDVDLRRTISHGEEQKMTADVGLECPELFRAPPPLPSQLTGVQTAQTADLLAYLHTSLLRALYAVQGTPNPADPLEEVTISAAAWHRLQRLQMDLAAYLKQIAEPRE